MRERTFGLVRPDGSENLSQRSFGDSEAGATQESWPELPYETGFPKCWTSQPTSTIGHRAPTSSAYTRAGFREKLVTATVPDISSAIPALQRFATNPIVTPGQISFDGLPAPSNPGATIDRASGRVVLLVRVFEEETKRSCLALALSSDGEHIDEIRDGPAIAREAPYEDWAQKTRASPTSSDQLYAITYTGYSPTGPRVCLITTDDLLKPERYKRHGPRITGDNKNCVIFPQKVGGAYVILHRPMPRIELIKVAALEDLWPAEGVPLVGPLPGTWRSSRVGSGAPPIATDIGWLFPFHGATSIEEGNVYSMGWCVLDSANPEKVLYVSVVPRSRPKPRTRSSSSRFLRWIWRTSGPECASSFRKHS